jgi:hypothetical protein
MKIITKRLFGMITIFILILTSFSVLPHAEPFPGSELEIVRIYGRIGRVCTEIKNIGDQEAEEVVITITVQGGIFQRINVTKICSGCGSCNTTIPPNGSKIECTNTFILGLGNIDITVTAEANNSAKVTNTKTGLVIGFFIIIQ